MKKPFDPFDERHLYKKKRRSREEIILFRKANHEAKIGPVRQKLEEFGWPNEVRSNIFLMSILAKTYENGLYYLIKNRLEVFMNELGYVKVKNPHAKDGRFKEENEKFFLYKKLHGEGEG